MTELGGLVPRWDVGVKKLLHAQLQNVVKGSALG